MILCRRGSRRVARTAKRDPWCHALDSSLPPPPGSVCRSMRGRSPSVVALSLTGPPQGAVLLVMHRSLIGHRNFSPSLSCVAASSPRVSNNRVRFGRAQYLQNGYMYSCILRLAQGTTCRKFVAAAGETVPEGGADERESSWRLSCGTSTWRHFLLGDSGVGERHLACPFDCSVKSDIQIQVSNLTRSPKEDGDSRESVRPLICQRRRREARRCQARADVCLKRGFR